MTRKRVEDDQYGQLWRRLTEVARRVDEGSILFDATMENLTKIIENRPLDPSAPLGEDRVDALVDDMFKPKATIIPITLEVDYDQSLNEISSEFKFGTPEIRDKALAPVLGRSGRQVVEISLWGGDFRHEAYMSRVFRDLIERELVVCDLDLRLLLALRQSRPDVVQAFHIAVLGFQDSRGRYMELRDGKRLSPFHPRSINKFQRVLTIKKQ